MKRTRKTDVFDGLSQEDQRDDVLAKLAVVVANVRGGVVHGPLQNTRGFQELMDAFDKMGSEKSVMPSTSIDSEELGGIEE